MIMLEEKQEAKQERKVNRRDLLRLLTAAGLAAVAGGALITKVTVTHDKALAQSGLDPCEPSEDKCGPWAVGG